MNWRATVCSRSCDALAFVVVAIVTTWSTGFLALPAGAAAGGGERPTAADEQWQRLLEAGLNRDVEARKQIESAAVDGVSEAVRKLAEVLLEEWEWPLDHPRLVQPRAIWYHHPEPDDLPADARHSLFPSIAVEGMVTSEGAFVDTLLKESTGNQKLDRLILDAAATVRFRPARQGDHYAEHRSMLVFHWSV